MIYIFDDKRSRQTSYNWNSEKFSAYADFVRPIYQYSEVATDYERNKIFSEGNVILFHESFFDADFNKKNKESLEIRRDLEAFAEKHNSFHLAFFSGSKAERASNGNVAYLPVSVLYANLEIFIHHAEKGNVDLHYLLYGSQPQIESEYLRRLVVANDSFSTHASVENIGGKRIFVARTIENELPRVVDEAEYKILNGSTDRYLHEKTIDFFRERKYDLIFIPLCFGKTLSDFNGLRLAIHIRCTSTPNQCSPVFIYGFVKMEELISHECFNILKTKNVHLIQYNLEAFDSAIRLNTIHLESTDLPKEMAKLKLDVPGNYEDNHSISNEWAIYRWANAIHADNDAIEKIIERINTQLYFKYLSTIYPISKITRVDQKELRLTYKGVPKILYVDDDAEKGWYEILCTLLSDINGFSSFDYLGDELKKISQEEIIEKTINKIREDDIDLVILDFRLHPDDFTSINIQEITGFKLLKKIKAFNPGIQVLVFSATTKIWNLQGLLDERVDAFIIKESPENSVDPDFTVKSIYSLIKQVDKCLSNIYLKDIWIMSKEIEKVFSKNPLTRKYFVKNLEGQSNGIKYQHLLLHEVEAVYDILTTSNENRFNLAMIMLFKILEYLNEIFYKRTSWDELPLFYDGGAVEYYDKNSKAWKKHTEKIKYLDKKSKTEVLAKIKMEWLKSTSNKVLNLAVKRLNIADSNLLSSLISLTEYRNDFIHSDTSKRGNLSRLGSNEILNWMHSITDIIKKI